MREDTIEQLKKIAKPKLFKTADYVCYEGQPGSEMYIILKGSVGIFLTSPIGTLNQVATIKEGGFFGEMAIFDNLPRSASCIALEDAICVAVNQDNLQDFLAACPDIAKQMLENLSGRIRKLDNELYKNNRFVKNRHVPKFEIPVEYSYSHVVKPPYQHERFLAEYSQACPICGKAIKVIDIKRNSLEARSMNLDCRINYVMCDPLWYEVVSCPHCHYTNHYLKFFGVNNFEHEVVEGVLIKEQRPVVRQGKDARSEFDTLVMQYLQAIHINEHINPGANALIGGMWRNLYWLSKDAQDEKFAAYCARKAADKLKAAIDGNEIPNANDKAAIAIVLASLMAYCGGSAEIPDYIKMGAECSNEMINENARILQERLNKIYQKK